MDGVIDVSVTVSPIVGPGGDVIGASVIARDISEHKLADALLAGERRALEMVTRGAPLSAVLDDLARTTEALAGEALLASVLLLDADGVHVRHGAAPSLPDEFMRAIDGEAIGPSAGSCGTAMYRRETVVVSRHRERSALGRLSRRSRSGTASVPAGPSQSSGRAARFSGRSRSTTLSRAIRRRPTCA